MNSGTSAGIRQLHISYALTTVLSLAHTTAKFRRRRVCKAHLQALQIIGTPCRVAQSSHHRNLFCCAAPPAIGVDHGTVIAAQWKFFTGLAELRRRSPIAARKFGGSGVSNK
jgi:hypothetical protein